MLKIYGFIYEDYGVVGIYVHQVVRAIMKLGNIATSTRIAAIAFLGWSSTSYSQVVVSNTPSQTINGIGASGAWWPIALFKYPDQVKQQAAHLLFSRSDDAVGLTSYRYNVGGGGVFVGDPGRAPETFQISPGVYNWSADPQGVYFLKLAAANGVPQITAFVNSAPPAFTNNSRSCGGTLLDAKIGAYAQYLTDVVAHWKTQGVTFTHISPMNEPDNGFNSDTVTPCGQEGMIVTPQQRASVVNTLRSSLNAAGLNSVQIMADESSQTGNFLPEAATWIPSAANSLGAVCHHNYGFGADDQVAQMGSLGRNLSGGRPTWFTEICCYKAANASQSHNPAAPLTYSQGFDPTMVGALQMANLVYQSFTQAQDAHFDWWTAISGELGCAPLTNSSCATSTNTQGWDDGLLYYDSASSTNGNFALYKTKRFFVLKHFTTFVPLGAVRYSVTGLPTNVRALSFKSSSYGTSVMFMNMGQSVVQINPSTVKGVTGHANSAFQTSPSSDWANLGSLASTTTLNLPALSITTVNYN